MPFLAVDSTRRCGTIYNQDSASTIYVFAGSKFSSEFNDCGFSEQPCEVLVSRLFTSARFNVGSGFNGYIDLVKNYLTGNDALVSETIYSGFTRAAWPQFSVVANDIVNESCVNNGISRNVCNPVADMNSVEPFTICFVNVSSFENLYISVVDFSKMMILHIDFSGNECYLDLAFGCMSISYLCDWALFSCNISDVNLINNCRCFNPSSISSGSILTSRLYTTLTCMLDVSFGGDIVAMRYSDICKFYFSCADVITMGDSSSCGVLSDGSFCVVGISAHYGALRSVDAYAYHGRDFLLSAPFVSLNASAIRCPCLSVCSGMFSSYRVEDLLSGGSSDPDVINVNAYGGVNKSVFDHVSFKYDKPTIAKNTLGVFSAYCDLYYGMLRTNMFSVDPRAYCKIERDALVKTFGTRVGSSNPSFNKSGPMAIASNTFIVYAPDDNHYFSHSFLYLNRYLHVGNGLVSNYINSDVGGVERVVIRHNTINIGRASNALYVFENYDGLLRFIVHGQSVNGLNNILSDADFYLHKGQYAMMTFMKNPSTTMEKIIELNGYCSIKDTIIINIDDRVSCGVDGIDKLCILLSPQSTINNELKNAGVDISAKLAQPVECRSVRHSHSTIIDSGYISFGVHSNRLGVGFLLPVIMPYNDGLMISC